MKILAIDSSGLVASVALLADGIVIGEYTNNNKKTHSQTLLPMIEAMLQMADTEVAELDAIAIASGPGSFTGLRIGAATAKGLAGALKIPIIPVPTLEALAYNFAGKGGIICPLMDARRRQVYYGVYYFEGDKLQVCVPQAAAPIEEMIEKVNEQGKEVTFLGDGVPVFQADLETKVRIPYFLSTAQNSLQRAGSVAVLGEKLWREKRSVKAEEFAPVYLRLSQAERERLEREKNK